MGELEFVREGLSFVQLENPRYSNCIIGVCSHSIKGFLKVPYMVMTGLCGRVCQGTVHALNHGD